MSEFDKHPGALGLSLNAKALLLFLERKVVNTSMCAESLMALLLHTYTHA